MKLVQAVSTFLLLSVGGVQSRLSSKYVSNLIKEEAGLVKDTLKEETKFAKDVVQERYGPQIVEGRAKAKIAQDVAESYEKKIEEDASLYKDIIEGQAGTVIHDITKTKNEALATVEEEASKFYNATMDEYASLEKVFNDEAGSLRKKLNKEVKSYEHTLEEQAASLYNTTMDEADTVKKSVEEFLSDVYNLTMVEGENIKKTVEDIYGDVTHMASSKTLECTSHTHRAACFSSKSCQWCTSSVIKEEIGACMTKEQVDDVAVELSLSCEHKQHNNVAEVDGGNMSEKHVVDGVDEDSVVVVENIKRMPIPGPKVVKKFSV